MIFKKIKGRVFRGRAGYQYAGTKRRMRRRAEGVKVLVILFSLPESGNRVTVTIFRMKLR
jgi:hypothetical protein